jgi:hypothetical protein
MAWALVHGIAKLAVAKRLPFRSPDEILRFAVSAIDASIAALQRPLNPGTVAREATRVSP